MSPSLLFPPIKGEKLHPPHPHSGESKDSPLYLHFVLTMHRKIVRFGQGGYYESG